MQWFKQRFMRRPKTLAERAQGAAKYSGVVMLIVNIIVFVASSFGGAVVYQKVHVKEECGFLIFGCEKNVTVEQTCD